MSGQQIFARCVIRCGMCDAEAELLVPMYRRVYSTNEVVFGLAETPLPDGWWLYRSSAPDGDEYRCGKHPRANG